MIYCTTFISLALALGYRGFFKISQRFKKFIHKKELSEKNPNAVLRKENFLFEERRHNELTVFDLLV